MSEASALISRAPAVRARSCCWTAKPASSIQGVALGPTAARPGSKVLRGSGLEEGAFREQTWDRISNKARCEASILDDLLDRIHFIMAYPVHASHRSIAPRNTCVAMTAIV